MQENLLFWIWLSEALGVGNPDFSRVIELYETPYDVYEADEEELERQIGLKEKTRLSLSNKNLQRATEIMDACQRLGIGILPYDSALYPYSLREIKKPPVLLYYVGTIPKFEERLCVGLIGTRRMSEYGRDMAYKISYELACGNAITVSGLAEGIDGVCAAATLRASGVTVAVLGCGLDLAYPTHHGKLMNAVAEKGVLLSEYPPGTKPLYYHFPARNRIISGLSHAVVVVEAGLGSGSLITAKEAVMQGKDVFAVPSRVGVDNAEGVNGLLRDGALVATCASDIAAKYEYLFPASFRADLVKQGAKRSHPDLEFLHDIGVCKSEKVPDEPLAQSSRRPCRTEENTKNKKEKDTLLNRRQETATQTQQMETTTKNSESESLLQSLTPIQLEVLQAIPDDRTISSDALVKLEHPYGEILTALTMLEIMGLVEKLPGAVYRKA